MDPATYRCTLIAARSQTLQGDPLAQQAQCNLRQAASSLSVFLTSTPPTTQFLSTIKFLQGEWGITPLPTPQESLREPQERCVRVYWKEQ